jgi:hypothetical protein
VFASGPQSRHNNLRVLLVADVLRRVVEDLHAGHVQLGMLLPSTAGRADDRLRMALPFAPETFGIRPSTEVGDHLDATAESLGQRRDCGPPTHRRAREDASIRSVRRDVALRAGEVTALAPPRDENRLRHELRCFAIAAASRCPRASHP